MSVVEELNSQEGSKFLLRLVKIIIAFVIILSIIIFSVIHGFKPLLNFLLWMKIIGGLFVLWFFFSVVKFMRVPAVTAVPAEWFWGRKIVFKQGLKIFIKFLMNIREFEWTTKTNAKTETKKLKSLDLRPVELNTSEEAIHLDNGRSKSACTVTFEVIDVKQAIFGVTDAPNMLDDKIRSSLRDIASRETFDAFCARKKGEIAEDVLELLKTKISLLSLRILSLDITSIEPIGDTKKFIEATLRARKEAEAKVIEANKQAKIRVIEAKSRKASHRIINRTIWEIAQHRDSTIAEAEMVFQERTEKITHQTAAEKGSTMVLGGQGVNVSVSATGKTSVDNPPVGKNIPWKDFDDDDDDDDNDDEDKS